MQHLKPEELLQKLSQKFGQQNWWPVTGKGKTIPEYKKRKKLTEKQKLEICLGAILAQNTSWKNAEKAIIALNKAGMVNCKKTCRAKKEKIASLIKSSGYYNQKAKRIKAFCRHLEKKYDDKTTHFFKKNQHELREELLQLHGIGKETADSIVLYAAQKPSFVVDAYTKRIAERYYGREFRSYEELKDFFEKQMEKKQENLAEMHALLVEHAKHFCQKNPLCKKCFLNKECHYFQKEH